MVILVLELEFCCYIEVLVIVIGVCLLQVTMWVVFVACCGHCFCFVGFVDHDGFYCVQVIREVVVQL